jgi:hypothetical protein
VEEQVALPSPAWTAFRAALGRPTMIPDILSAAWAFRRRDWYRRPPFLPLPSSSYLRWRMETAYGDPDAVPPVDELRRFLRWARRTRKGNQLPNKETRWAG